MTARALLLAGLGALLPLGTPVRAEQPAPRAARFVPPDGPVTLTRTVWRTLNDGKQIRVARSYTIEFVPTANGFVVDGKLVGTEVEAPTLVAPLAELERKRPETGLFPIHLDRNGMILPEPADFNPEPGRAAIAAGNAVLGKEGAPAPLREQARQMMNQIAAASASAARRAGNWPGDLFNPAEVHGLVRHDLALADGTKGQVAIAIDVDCPSPGRIPRSFERRVTTTLEGTRRLSREVWTMGPG